MDELAKVRRVIAKQMPDAPHETLISIDATTGQNGLRQAKIFAEAVEVDGVVLTKLDGTAKGGIVLAIADELGIPVKLIGIGETLEDLRPFDPADFARALLQPPKLSERVRPALRAAAGDALRRSLARQAERGRRRRGDARDPPRPARGRRQLQGRQIVHRDAQGALPRRRGAGEPRSRPAGGQDRQRGADRADGWHGQRAGVGLQRPDRDPDGRPAGLRQDDRLREARPLRLGSPARTSPSPPATSTARPRSISSSPSPETSARTSTSRGPTPIRSRSPPGRSTAPARSGRDVLIVDTAGRLHVDEDLMDELARIRKRIKPHDVLLVVDAMTGQDAVGVAEVLRRDGRVRRRRDDQARRRRPRRRSALGQGGDRQADPVRLDRREARGLRPLPPRPHGLAHPRHGRRAQPDRESRAAGRRAAGARSARRS